MIKQAYKLFYKTKYLFFCFLGFGIFILTRICMVFFRWIYVVEFPAADSLLYRTNDMSILYFILFLLISYELNSIMKRNGISETLYFCNKGRGYISNIIMLSICNFIFSVVVWFINILGYCIKFVENSRYLWNITNNIFVNYILIGTLAILIGAIISNIKNKKLDYILILVLFILISPIMDILGEIFYDNDLFYKIKWWFSFLPQGLSFVENYYIGFVVQIQKVSLVCLWIMCCIVIQQILLRVKWKKIVLSLIGVIVFTIGCIIPGHELTPSYQDNNWMFYPRQYYEQQENDFNKTYAYFKVDNYNIDFTILNQLYAEVKMSIAPNDLAEYAFTLYHAYEVRDVMDQNGNSLLFNRNGDYLTVQTDGQSVSELTIAYVGTGIPFYSEFGGTFLKSGIAFYPIVGYHKQYEDGKFIDVVSEKTNYNVSVHSLNDFYCTLEQVDKNRFSGNSESFTLIDGIISVDQINDVTFVYPVLTVFSREIQDIERAFIEEMDAAREENDFDYSIHQKIVIMDVKSNAEPIASFFDDHMIVYGYQFAGFVEDEYFRYCMKESGDNP